MYSINLQYNLCKTKQYADPVLGNAKPAAFELLNCWFYHQPIAGSSLTRKASNRQPALSSIFLVLHIYVELRNYKVFGYCLKSIDFLHGVSRAKSEENDISKNFLMLHNFVALIEIDTFLWV